MFFHLRRHTLEFTPLMLRDEPPAYVFVSGDEFG